MTRDEALTFAIINLANAILMLAEENSSAAYLVQDAKDIANNWGKP